MSKPKKHKWIFPARFRAVAMRYPMKDKSQILTDLIAATPGEEGK